MQRSEIRDGVAVENLDFAALHQGYLSLFPSKKQELI
jgi:hypothetical protein